MTRHIYKRGNKYEVRKNHDGTVYTFGKFSTLEQAQLIRDTLETINWGFSTDPLRNITKVNNYYRVQKMINGEIVYCNHFPTLEEAQHERDLLESNDWSIDNV